MIEEITVSKMKHFNTNIFPTYTYDRTDR